MSKTARKVPLFSKHLSMMMSPAKLMSADTESTLRFCEMGKPVSGIEVRDTHPVDDAKWDAFEELRFPCIEVASKDVIYMWEYDLKSWREPIPKLPVPMRLDLRAIKHNLHLFNDRLHRIYCEACDEETE